MDTVGPTALGAEPAILCNIGYACGHGLGQWLSPATDQLVNLLVRIRGRAGTAVACHSSLNARIRAPGKEGPTGPSNCYVCSFRLVKLSCRSVSTRTFERALRKVLRRAQQKEKLGPEQSPAPAQSWQLLLLNKKDASFSDLMKTTPPTEPRNRRSNFVLTRSQRSEKSSWRIRVMVAYA